MGELATMNSTGDTKLYWSVGAPAEVEAARETFNKLRGKGYLAFRMQPGGTQGAQITEFDPGAEQIILAPAMRGG